MCFVSERVRRQQQRKRASDSSPAPQPRMPKLVFQSSIETHHTNYKTPYSLKLLVPRRELQRKTLAFETTVQDTCTG